MRVLLIDDDARLAELLVGYLAPQGVTLVHAPGGQAGLSQLAAGAFDAILLDVMMPGLDGVEVCRRVRADGTKVLMLTARDDADVEQASKDAGADGFLAKPFSSVELLDKVEQLTRRSGRAT